MATEGNPQATIVGDLTDAPHIPDDTFDCAIVTQTLQFVYDVRAALATLHRILAPGGVLLATVPGITKISPPEDEEFGEWWHYTARSLRAARRGGVRRRGTSRRTPYGNVLSAAGFLYGLAASDLRPRGARCPRPPLRGDRRRASREASGLAAAEDAPRGALELPVRPSGAAAAPPFQACARARRAAAEPDTSASPSTAASTAYSASSTSVGNRNAGVSPAAIARNASRSRVSTTSRPSATPRSSSSSETTSAS